MAETGGWRGGSATICHTMQVQHFLRPSGATVISIEVLTAITAVQLRLIYTRATAVTVELRTAVTVELLLIVLIQ